MPDPNIVLFIYSCKVYYADYGSFGFVNRAHIKLIKRKFTDVPFFAVKGLYTSDTSHSRVFSIC